MKNIISILFMLACFALSAQQDSVIYLNTETKVVLETYNRQGSAEEIPKAELRVFTKSHDVYRTGTGQFYVIYQDGEVERRRYLGWLTPHRYEDMSVFTNSTGTRHWYLQIDEQGLPERVELPGFVFSR